MSTPICYNIEKLAEVVLMVGDKTDRVPGRDYLVRVSICEGGAGNPVRDLESWVWERFKMKEPFIIGNPVETVWLARCLLMHCCDVQSVDRTCSNEFARDFLSGSGSEWPADKVIESSELERWLADRGTRPYWITDDDEPGVVGAST